jgi:hypothetical protein
METRMKLREPYKGHILEAVSFERSDRQGFVSDLIIEKPGGEDVSVIQFRAPGTFNTEELALRNAVGFGRYRVDSAMRTPSNRNLRELVTEVLDRTGQRNAIKVVVNFLRAKKIEQVRVEIGSVWGRDGNLKVEGADQTIRLSDLESFIEQGLNGGTIEWGRRSDSHLYPTGTDLDLMLCNDADLHITSADASLLLDLGRVISASGIKVYVSDQFL